MPAPISSVSLGRRLRARSCHSPASPPAGRRHASRPRPALTHAHRPAARGARQPVLGLVPAVRRADQFDEPAPGGETHQQEVRASAARRSGNRTSRAARSPGHRKQHRQEPRDEQGDRRAAAGSPRSRHGRESRSPRTGRSRRPPAPSERVEKRGDHRARHEGKGAERAQRAELPDRRTRARAWVRARLQEPLHPAGALMQPGPKAARRLLQGIARQNPPRVARPRQADTQIRILGHVEGVPTMDGAAARRAEMRGGAPEGIGRRQRPAPEPARRTGPRTRWRSTGSGGRPRGCR